MSHMRLSSRAAALGMLPQVAQDIGFALAALVDEHGTRIVVLLALGLVLRRLARGEVSPVTKR